MTNALKEAERDYICDYMDRERYPCPYVNKCPLGVGTATCFCNEHNKYWQKKELGIKL